jgi:hypothetical protein
MMCLFTVKKHYDFVRQLARLFTHLINTSKIVQRFNLGLIY